MYLKKYPVYRMSIFCDQQTAPSPFVHYNALLEINLAPIHRFLVKAWKLFPCEDNDINAA